jgi:hypothetical protein
MALSPFWVKWDREKKKEMLLRLAKTTLPLFTFAKGDFLYGDVQDYTTTGEGPETVYHFSLKDGKTIEGKMIAHEDVFQAFFEGWLDYKREFKEDPLKGDAWRN